MNLDVIQDQPAPARPEARREHVQWLTCTSCAVAWIGMWSQEACWCCERAEDVQIRWAA